MERKTPLYDRHVAAGGKIVPFAGWLLPVQYAGVIAEHRAVRSACGLFDVSHMGEIVLRGSEALENLNRLMTNDFSDLGGGQARYSPMCDERGGVVDDLIVYKCGAGSYLVVVNAANTEKDFQWICSHLTPGCEAEDISGQVAQLALQGPKAEDILSRLTREIPAKNYTAVRGTVAGLGCLISRTGYTGEDGFELYCAPKDAVKLWPRPATPASPWATRSMCAARTQRGCGTAWWKWAHTPPAWAPGTPCAWRPPCPSTATSSQRISTPTRRVWASSSSWTNQTSLAAPPWSRPALYSAAV